MYWYAGSVSSFSVETMGGGGHVQVQGGHYEDSGLSWP